MGTGSDLECPACGEDDDLSGRGAPDGTITISCGRCSTSWERDPTPRCDRCEGDALEPALLAVVERSRGSQLSIVGTRTVHLCKACDAEVLAVYRTSRSPLMPDQLPTANSR